MVTGTNMKFKSGISIAVGALKAEHNPAKAAPQSTQMPEKDSDHHELIG